MIKIITLILFLLEFFSVEISAQQDISNIKVGFLTRDKNFQYNQELAAAFSFLQKNFRYTRSITFSEIKSDPEHLNDINVIWFHRPDSVDFSNEETESQVISSIKKFIEMGGNLLLTLDAMKLVVPLGLESANPQINYVEAFDEGYGRKLGLHSFKSHPIFHNLYGGAYIWAPLKDQLNRQVGFFKNSIPNGKVAAVDWAYITLKEDSKLVLEYVLGKGKIIAVGSYTYYSPENQNKQHLELFTKNCLEYLTGNNLNEIPRYWNYNPFQILPFTYLSENIVIPPANIWNRNLESLTINSQFASENNFDITGERMMIMGKEKGGIEEIWSHPFMTLRDYEVGVKFSYRDTIYWFNDQIPQIEVRPESFTRTYRFVRAFVKEIITTDRENPVGVIHYEYRGVYPGQLVIRFKSNMRFMWPYSQNTSDSIFYGWCEQLNSFIIKAQNDELVMIIGSNKKPVSKLSGQFEDFTKSDTTFEGQPTDKFQVAALFTFDLGMNDNMDIIVVGTNEGEKSALASYSEAISNPEKIYLNSTKYYREFLSNGLIITTPDATFNEGYRWAMVGTDKFFVNTPGIGKSLVAGYSTTAKGWDGAQPISGRPGYAWYFGRDGQWSGMAISDYGDFQKVKEVLQFYQKYQDLSGKIFHELTTSGAVHYDAADATPLYIILAGHYLRWSGDIDFIRDSWSNIKKAIDFLYTTDTDGDRLIENTNVGHGWIEGGSLYGAKTTFYLAGCWAAALGQAEYIADVLGFESEANKYRKDFENVMKIVNNDFWNGKTHFFNYGKLPDNTYNQERTILPAVPLYFNLADKEKAAAVLDVYAGNGFSTNWGVRILSDQSPLFNPRGYHYGSVWPLFTGWTALAEYQYGNYLQGFSHIMNNLKVYENWARGYVEEVLNGSEYLPSGVCPHQCWSETMVLQPILEGMLGLRASALENTLMFAPRFPPDWDSVQIENIKVGSHLVNVKMMRKDKKTSYYFSHTGDKQLKIEFSPYFMQGMEFVKIILKNNEYKPEPLISKQNVYLNLFLELEKELLVEIYHSGGISVLPVVPNPKPGDASEGFRIISSDLKNNIYTVEVEGKSGSEEILKVVMGDKIINSVDNGELISSEENIYSIRVIFEKSDSKYLRKVITIHL
ncbi:MAG: hypothetical protein A2V93_07935 [Ignavibacteria bacterium RBG_16_34_14]|nr:MAG: hypothetical protein A2V93_07935 [Ignavibacteria bacterium RBG_16_34_14]